MQTQAQRLDQVKFSPVRQILGKAKDLEAQGRNIIHFEIGEPDFDTPKEIVKQTVKALQEEKATHYASNLGNLALRKAIAEKMEKKNGINADPETEILVTVGAAEAIFVSIMALVNAGDEVIVLTPAFMFYENTIKMAGATMVEVMLKKENRFQLSIDDIKEKITSKTKMIIINNPHNPSGTVFGKEELMALGALAVEKGIYLLADEIYDEIVYDGITCFSPASIKHFKENTITINGFSKAYAMTGWRIGYVIANAEVRKAMLKVHQYTTTCLPTFIQIGTARAMNTPACLAEVEHMRKIFENRRNLLQEKLNAITGITYVPVQGAFYLLVDISNFRMNDVQFAERLLEEKGVAVVPASGFSSSFKNHIRISYAVTDEDIQIGLGRFAEFCSELEKERK